MRCVTLYSAITAFIKIPVDTWFIALEVRTKVDMILIIIYMRLSSIPILASYLHTNADEHCLHPTVLDKLIHCTKTWGILTISRARAAYARDASC
jgi:hypothetical protein